MKIVIAHPISSQLVEPGLGESVVYRPDLAASSNFELRRTLLELAPDAALVEGNRVDDATLAEWRSRTQSRVQLIRRLQPDEERSVVSGQDDVQDVVGVVDDSAADLTALGLADRGIASHEAVRRLAPLGVAPNTTRTLQGRRVTLVGAGIVNLLTALELVERGAQVEVFEASPDPRTRPPWQQLGATHGGGNARMFTFTEADNYNEKNHLVYSKMHEAFSRPASEGGWLLLTPDELDAEERAWIDRFHAVPHWRAKVFTEDIHGFSIASEPMWDELRSRMPDLFEDVGYSPGILRLYAQPEKVQAAEALQSRLDGRTRALGPDELARRHPGCRDAVEAGWIAGGLEVSGFTLNVHDFVGKLLSRLEASGVHFRWRDPVQAVERAENGLIRGLRTKSGLVRTEHYVLSPGAHVGQLLTGTRSEGKIQGVSGFWMMLPHLEPHLCHSLKLHREGHVGEDSNITLARDAEGRPQLIVGSGYGYLGRRALDMTSPEVARLFEALELTAQRYFPRSYEAAVREGSIRFDRKGCIRPFTVTGLGVFEVLGTEAEGRLVITSGHNTGGFAQAPSVANAVAETLCGRPHPMQALYDPERGVPRTALRS